MLGGWQPPINLKKFGICSGSIRNVKAGEKKAGFKEKGAAVWSLYHGRTMKIKSTAGSTAKQFRLLRTQFGVGFVAKNPDPFYT